jgi:hypothetical protein
MGRLLNIGTPVRKMTKQGYVGGMMERKAHRMMKATVWLWRPSVRRLVAA